MRIASLIGGAVLLFNAAGCAKPATAGLSDADKVAIEAQEQFFAKQMAAGDVAGVMKSYYAPDAVVLAPNAPAITGAAAIEAMFKSMGAVGSMTMTTDEVAGMGDLAYVRGRYAMTFTPAGMTAAISDSGKYLEVFKKQADGTWKNYRDMFSSDVPLPAAPAPGPAKKK
jgi:ketosteroid isomerase-like protein